jgi:hypothetical protein
MHGTIRVLYIIFIFCTSVFLLGKHGSICAFCFYQRLLVGWFSWAAEEAHRLTSQTVEAHQINSTGCPSRSGSWNTHQRFDPRAVIEPG